MTKLAIFAAVAAIFTFITPAHAQSTITVYCSILEEQCREGVAMFERANPGTKVQMVRKSTGEAYAQIKAEATNPKADVWWGGPAEPHLQAGEEGLLDTYKSPALASIHDWAQRLAEQSKGAPPASTSARSASATTPKC